MTTTLRTKLDRVAQDLRPRRVLDVNVGPHAPLTDLDNLGPYEVLFAIVRVNGVPVGYAEVPIKDGRCTSQELAAGIFSQCEAAIVDHLLVRSLADGTFPERLGSPSWTKEQPRRSNTPLPPMTVAVCTRDRRSDLERCLTSLGQVDYPGLDQLVIDNAPDSAATKRFVETAHPSVRYIHEPCPGLNWARRRAIQESTSEVMAFVDDDVTVDADWAHRVGAVMADYPDVAALTGLVVPAELETAAQLRFERLGGLGKGFVRRWHRWRRDDSAARIYATTGTIGVGANMAFRRSVFEEVGLFDPALGAGTMTGGGDDLDLFFRVQRTGHTLVYEPSAVVRHRHRKDESALETQLNAWCMGNLAGLASNMRAFPKDRTALAGLAARLLLVYYPRRVAQSFVDPKLPLSLALAEWTGALMGLSRYGRAHQRAGDLAAQFGHAIDSAPIARVGSRARVGGSRRKLRLDLDVPLPEVLPGSDECDEAQVEVVRGNRAVGSITIVTGGHLIGRARLSDTLVSVLGRHRIDPADEMGSAFRRLQVLG